MYPRAEPFAMQLYRRYRGGETIQQLSSELAIPAERIRQRIEAAAAHRERSRQTDGLSPCAASMMALAEQVLQQ